MALALASLAIVPDVPVARKLLALAAVTAAAVSHGAAARERAVSPPIVQWLDRTSIDATRSPGPAVVRGWLAADAAATEFGVRLVIDVRDIREGPGWRAAAGRVQAYVAGELAAAGAADWTAGRTIVTSVSLRRPQVLLNPGGPGRLNQTLRRPFHLAGTVKSAALVSVERGAWWDEAAAAIRRRVRHAVSRHVPAGPAAAIVTAILIGDRAGLSDEIERRLQAAGTYHVIAISGGNVALLVLLTTAIVHVVVRPHRAGLVMALVLVNAYGWIVGGEPSVQRAVAAGTIYLVARLIGLVPPAVHVLSTVAMVVVAIDPLTVIDVGAWLSFGATLGIVLYARRFAGLGVRVPASLVAVFCATLAAELALLPIGAAVFSRVSLAGLVLNFVAIPAMAVVQLAGILLVALDLFWNAGAAFAARIAGAAAGWLVGSSALVDVAPWLSWRVPPPSPIWTAGYYAAWTLALWRGGPRRVRQACLAAAIASTIVVMSAPAIGRTPPSGGLLRVTMIDVGQGDAIVVQFPTGQSLLVDCGGTPGPFDIGGRVVTPSLWALGIRRLDWLVITHADLDHIGGARSVLNDLVPREVWEGVPVPRSREVQALRADARARGTAWRTVRAGARLDVGDVALDVLHPPPPEWERQKVRNDDSVVLRVTYGRVEFLLTGDAASEFEHRRPESSTALLRILKVAHHGSRTSSAAAFLDRFRPHVALVSAGRGNLFGHPAPEVLARLADIGSTIFRTDRDAATIVETDGRVVTLRTMTGRTLELRATKTPEVVGRRPK
jgi:competence protein ComEC